MERWAQWHCVNHHLGSVVEFEPDDLEQVPAGSAPMARILGGSAAGSSSMMVRACSSACRIASRSRPCLNAERWNSTHNYRNTKSRLGASHHPDSAPHATGTSGSEAALGLLATPRRDCHVQHDQAVDELDLKSRQPQRSGEGEREDAEAHGLSADPHNREAP